MSRPAILLLLLLALLLLVPLFVPTDPHTTNTSVALTPPDSLHPLGTDWLGRDVFSRVVHGGQRTILIAGLATLVAILPGIALGLAAGSLGRYADELIGAFVNAILAFPTLLQALVIVTLLGTGPLTVALATGAALVAQYARVARAAILEAKAAPHVEAARALGASEARIALRHVLPSATPILVAFAGVTFAYSVLNSAALSFLGLAGDLGAPDWGAMLYEARVTFRVAPWASIAPGAAITVMVYAINRLADLTLEQSRFGSRV